MSILINSPFIFFVCSIIAFIAMANLGVRNSARIEEVRKDLDVMLSATLTLLGLVIGFTLSMAADRYGQRKLYEQSETNAISTEYIRAELLPAPASTALKEMLKEYTRQRILFYQVRGGAALANANSGTARLQEQMWTSARTASAGQATPVVTLVLGGMNEVLDTQGNTDAGWKNRIPVEAWTLLVAIALFANFMVGMSLRGGGRSKKLLAIFPAVVALALLLIADIDSPRTGLVRIPADNLVAFAQSIHP